MLSIFLCLCQFLQQLAFNFFCFCFVGLQHQNEIILSMNGGRYDVNLRRRTRHAIYWEEAPSKVRRCTWFFKSDGENKFVPYEEELASTLEV